MELKEMYGYILSLLQEASGPERPAAAGGDALTMVELISQARVALDILEAQAVHELRTTLPQTSYGDIGAAQGISKQASRIRHAKLEQVLKVHQLDGHRHSLSKAAVSARHRRAARPTREARRTHQ
jgi:hypothetical protein